MKAAIYRRTGDSSVLSVEELQTPEPGPGQVRVEVAASGVNPTDWKSRAGRTRGEPDDFQVPHQDGAGTIDAVGQAVVDRAVGQRVWVALAAYENRYGTAAELCVVPAERTVPLPDEASFELGASLGVPAVTAAHALGGDPSSLSGQTVLVAGGAGAVGHFAIELAKHAGARAIATVSNPEKAKLALDAGADLVVDYKDEDAAEQIRAFAPHVDRIVELALGANLGLDLALARPGTVISIYANEQGDPALPTRQLMAANVCLHYMLLYGVPKDELAAAVDWVSDALAAGALSELPLHTFPLDRIAEAQDAVEAGAVGKVLVLP
ncbi:MAG: NADPH:quinone reductase [Solirubrobacteraceae bacterium]